MQQILTILAMTRDELNESPIVKYIALAIFLIGGPLLILNGIRGIKNRDITVKSRRRTTQYTGDQAVLAGWVQVGLGALFIIVALFTLAFR